jgi:hypothetical protein
MVGRRGRTSGVQAAAINKTKFNVMQSKLRLIKEDGDNTEES